LNDGLAMRTDAKTAPPRYIMRENSSPFSKHVVGHLRFEDIGVGQKQFLRLRVLDLSTDVSNTDLGDCRSNISTDVDKGKSIFKSDNESNEIQLQYE